MKYGILFISSPFRKKGMIIKSEKRYTFADVLYICPYKVTDKRKADKQ
jgi:hypothetical protein